MASKPKRVTKEGGDTIDGIDMEQGDVYFYAMWLDFEEDNTSGGRKFVLCDQEEPELVHLAGAVIPYKIGVMKEGGKQFTMSAAHHAAVMARNKTL